VILGGLLGRLARLWEEKLRVARRLEELIGAEAAGRARRDHHARRPPRPCGMTIHTGIGCSMGCIYCYVPDMGFPMRPRPYPLEPLEMAYALAVNPYVLPEATLAAYGSVTEPFLPETRDRALAYIREVYRWLRLPSQVSTKALLDEGLSGALRGAEPRISVLVSVSAIGEWGRRLEPGAPPAEDRIQAAGRAVRRGLSVALFLRPIIPGVTDRQFEEILRLAAEAGLRHVVPGMLRVTPGILRRLEAAGVPMGEIYRRLPRQPRSRDDQVPLRGGDLKARLSRLAGEYGLEILPAACSHNIVSHGEYCRACRLGPCGDPSKAWTPSPGEVQELLDAAGLRARVLAVDSVIRLKAPPGDARRAKILLEAAARLPVSLVRG
jgi:DNA repair photolyase